MGSVGWLIAWSSPYLCVSPHDGCEQKQEKIKAKREARRKMQNKEGGSSGGGSGGSAAGTGKKRVDL